MPKYPDTPWRRLQTDLKQAGARPRKRLSQNFLLNRTVVDKIISAAVLTPADTVIEVGPGLGVLTEELAKSAGRVIAVELDHGLFTRLQKNLKANTNLHLVQGDILKIDLAQLLGSIREYKVVANLPYNITSPVLNIFMRAALRPLKMVVMLQKEVADSIMAGGGRLSVLGVGLRVHCIPSLVAYVPRRDFYPVSQVDSAVLHLDFLPQPLIPSSEQGTFMEMVRRGFRAPRKYLRNSLALGLDIKTIDAEALLREALIDPYLRAEDVTMEGWLRLYTVTRSGEITGQ